ncbi:F-box family protein [Klebsormidium nitens]|uniref:F-box family protein n=1 Tax=Klebsormidium nitens TaxID=105231 RepID=A0A1Y1IEB7_KLENI|nr:F-box family protein [Klebsormidium nitens]|eukprot:GAQ89295.1 F-box family protein [Klebsormidium nitens]
MAAEALDSPSQQATSIQDLPAECLGLIFKGLKAKDRHACSEVSRAWKLLDEETREDLYIGLMFKRGRKPISTPAALALVLQRFKNLQRHTLVDMELSPQLLHAAGTV